jgi:hypothetical protein
MLLQRATAIKVKNFFFLIIPFKDLRISIFYNVHKYLHNFYFFQNLFSVNILKKVYNKVI